MNVLISDRIAKCKIKVIRLEEFLVVTLFHKKESDPIYEKKLLKAEVLAS